MNLVEVLRIDVLKIEEVEAIDRTFREDFERWETIKQGRGSS